MAEEKLAFSKTIITLCMAVLTVIASLRLILPRNFQSIYDITAILMNYLFIFLFGALFSSGASLYLQRFKMKEKVVNIFDAIAGILFLIVFFLLIIVITVGYFSQNPNSIG